ncbi:hypothetical protein NUU61_006091 [Penicillium alfredii]|uniref:Uncharacterized protein n=1 Tax=Penicillium alfredii TaxID=1506179 RepID=A0A9W9F0H8_9EURO|nr:uncharacterized protein NUU61_006091 [Penicillium alfredii]KAJ5091221.1 hypothetical protein NUU61_006091 [Penicillium alfredii]
MFSEDRRFSWWMCLGEGVKVRGGSEVAPFGDNAKPIWVKRGLRGLRNESPPRDIGETTVFSSAE